MTAAIAVTVQFKPENAVRIGTEPFVCTAFQETEAFLVLYMKDGHININKENYNGFTAHPHTGHNPSVFNPKDDPFKYRHLEEELPPIDFDDEDEEETKELILENGRRIDHKIIDYYLKGQDLNLTSTELEAMINYLIERHGLEALNELDAEDIATWIAETIEDHE